jgi:hypothetical protein
MNYVGYEGGYMKARFWQDSDLHPGSHSLQAACRQAAGRQPARSGLSNFKLDRLESREFSKPA